MITRNDPADEPNYRYPNQPENSQNILDIPDCMVGHVYHH